MMANAREANFRLQQIPLNAVYCSKIEKIEKTTKDFSCDSCNNTMYSCQMQNIREIKPLIDIGAFKSVCRDISGLGNKIGITQPTDCGNTSSKNCTDYIFNELCFCKIFENHKSFVKITQACVCFNEDDERKKEVSMCNHCKMVRRICTMDLDKNKKQVPFSPYGSNPLICLVHSYPFYFEHPQNCLHNRRKIQNEKPLVNRNLSTTTTDFFEDPKKEKIKKRNIKIKKTVGKKNSNVSTSTSNEIMEIKKIYEDMQNKKNNKLEDLYHVENLMNKIKFLPINKSITYSGRNEQLLIFDNMQNVSVNSLMKFICDVLIYVNFLLLIFMTITYTCKGLHKGIFKRKKRTKDNFSYIAL